MVPQFALGLAVSALKWNGFRIPIFLAALALTLNARCIWRWCRRPRLSSDKQGNQNTFEGLPPGDVAAFLKRTGGWKLDEVTKELGLSEWKWKKVAETLEKHGVLVRGPNNARVLRDIGLTQLVRQLRDDFPLIWDDISKSWVEKDDAYGRHLREKSFRTRRLEEETSRKERKLERVEKKLEERSEELEELSAFTDSPSVTQVLALAQHSAQ